MKRHLRSWALLIAGAAMLGGLVLVSGIVPVAASSGHWRVTEWFLHFAMRRSVATHSLGIDVPPLDDSRQVLMGAGHYDGACRPCHGAPEEGPPPIPSSMTPKAPHLPERVVDYDDAELFYIIRHGIKFTGMPAWPVADRDDEAWAMVAFVRRLPTMTRQEYRNLVVHQTPTKEPAPDVVVRRCARCHGEDGLGRGVGAFPKLAGQRSAYLRASMSAYATGARPSGIMGPIAVALSEQDMQRVSEWYASQAPGPASGPDSARGREIAEQGVAERKIPACNACHGPDRPRNPTYPRLDGQYPEYLELQLGLFERKTRGGTPFANVMEAVTAHGLTPDEAREVSRHYAARGSRD